MSKDSILEAGTAQATQGLLSLPRELIDRIVYFCTTDDHFEPDLSLTSRRINCRTLCRVCHRLRNVALEPLYRVPFFDNRLQLVQFMRTIHNDPERGLLVKNFTANPGRFSKEEVRISALDKFTYVRKLTLASSYGKWLITLLPLQYDLFPLLEFCHVDFRAPNIGAGLETISIAKLLALWAAPRLKEFRLSDARLLGGSFSKQHLECGTIPFPSGLDAVETLVLHNVDFGESDVRLFLHTRSARSLSITPIFYPHSSQSVPLLLWLLGPQLHSLSYCYFGQLGPRPETPDHRLEPNLPFPTPVLDTCYQLERLWIGAGHLSRDVLHRGPRNWNYRAPCGQPKLAVKLPMRVRELHVEIQTCATDRGRVYKLLVEMMYDSMSVWPSLDLLELVFISCPGHRSRPSWSHRHIAEAEATALNKTTNEEDSSDGTPEHISLLCACYEAGVQLKTRVEVEACLAL